MAKKPRTTEISTELGRSDLQLLNLAADDYSFEEIAEMVPGDRSPAEIGHRIRSILTARGGALTLAEKSALHLHDLQQLKKKAWGMLDGEEGTRALTGIAAIMQQIGLRIDQMALNASETMGKIHRAQAREFAAVLELTYDRVIGRLAKKHPEIDENEIRVMFAEEFPKAVARIDALVEDGEPSA